VLCCAELVCTLSGIMKFFFIEYPLPLQREFAPCTSPVLSQ
jgi:hypothetical protein